MKAVESQQRKYAESEQTTDNLQSSIVRACFVHFTVLLSNLFIYICNDKRAKNNTKSYCVFVREHERTVRVRVFYGWSLN